MPTREIDRNDWNAFFASFSRKHAGWLATVEVMVPKLGDQIAMQNLPLLGIELTDGEIEISVNGPDRHSAHRIDAPRRVWLEQAEDGADEALEIEGAGGTTLIRFRAAVPCDAIGGS